MLLIGWAISECDLVWQNKIHRKSQKMLRKIPLLSQIHGQTLESFILRHYQGLVKGDILTFILTWREYFYSQPTNFYSQPKMSWLKQSSSPFTKPWALCSFIICFFWCIGNIFIRISRLNTIYKVPEQVPLQFPTKHLFFFWQMGQFKLLWTRTNCDFLSIGITETDPNRFLEP